MADNLGRQEGGALRGSRLFQQPWLYHELGHSLPIRVIAHRGASAFAPENTAPAFVAAVAAASDAIETDIRLSRDGVPVLIHDATLERTTDAPARFPDRAPWRVADFTWDELATLDAGSWFHPIFTGTKLLRLTDALLFFVRYGSDFLLELKPQDNNGDELVDAVCATLIRYGLNPQLRPTVTHWINSFKLQSFDADCVRALEKRLPYVFRYQLLSRPDEVTDEALAGISQYAMGIAIHHSIASESVVRRARADFVHVAVWTTVTSDQIAEAVSASPDFLIADDPIAARAVILSLKGHSSRRTY